MYFIDGIGVLLPADLEMVGLARAIFHWDFFFSFPLISRNARNFLLVSLTYLIVAAGSLFPCTCIGDNTRAFHLSNNLLNGIIVFFFQQCDY